MGNLFEEQLKARNELIEEMKREMLGPGSEKGCTDCARELISAFPEKRYCIGVLYPQGNAQNIEDDETMGEDTNSRELSEDDEDTQKKDDENEGKKFLGKADMEDSIDETISMSTKLLPSSMGITFVSNSKLDKLSIRVKLGIYNKAQVSDCKIHIDDSISDRFEIPDPFKSFFSYDKDKQELALLSKFDRKQIRYWYDVDKADDGLFKPYAYKMLEFLRAGYVREPKEFSHTIFFNASDFYNSNETLGDTSGKICALRYRLKKEVYSYTIMLVNTIVGKPVTKNCLFQPEIIVDTDDNNKLVFCDYSSFRKESDLSEEEASNLLLYRNKKSYGVGLGTAVDWEINSDGKGYIKNDFFPRVEVPQTDFSVDKKYEVEQNTFSMKYLSDLYDAPKEEKIKKICELLEAYEKWIKELDNQIEGLEEHHKKTAKKHIDNCRYCLKRMRNGIKVLETSENAWNAFALANRAMYMQRIHIGIQSRFDNVYPDVSPASDELSDILYDLNYYEEEDKYFWRPFQLAFLIMSVDSITDDSINNSVRDIVDLIWFPTGGGKTEAYLGLTAFTIFYRKLAFSDESGGTTVIMRYTLRLLAAQQFTRAATLICACEFIRKECYRKKTNYPKYDIGEESISIGLWIGGEHTPNKLKDAKKCYDELSIANKTNLNYLKERYNKFQVLKCPWCGAKLVKDIDSKGQVVGKWGYHVPNGKQFYMTCQQDGCSFENKLPLQIVDEELYKKPPTLLFATVDKFAMLPWYSEIGSFFAVNSKNRTPELIIQDELHLISGPLGSMVGIYETVIDYLCSAKGVRPKIIASTATICRAKEQCSSLYNREVFQYPPQGLDEKDSFFARSANIEEKYGRTYIGLLPAGKTKATMEGKVLSALLQLEQEREEADDVKDCYWTVTTYFNSLKELGKCSTIIQNDVRDNIRRMANRNFGLHGMRSILRPDELTSRVSTTELNLTLNKLEKVRFSSDPEKKSYPSNVLLATNMISVGIDVDRLNVMVMVGQPKLTSEYIQASSRVGRRYPGVVFVMYDGTRSRDRSHYEQFKSYHESFYRFVEPTGLTPFSEPARNRALHAVVLSIIRHGLGFETDNDISTFNRIEMHDALQEVSDYILNRIDEINGRLDFKVKSEREKTNEEINLVYEKIDDLVKQSDNKLEYGNVMGFKKNDKCRRLMKPYGTDEMEPYTFDTLTSMRNVDSSVNVNVVILEDINE